jgi:hypothetical protein
MATDTATAAAASSLASSSSSSSLARFRADYSLAPKKSIRRAML